MVRSGTINSIVVCEMRFEIRHLTRYIYTDSVHLGPHLLRLRPHDSPAQTVLAYSCDIRPHPAGVSEIVDIYGNRALRAWFDGSTRFLELEINAVVETLRRNPFDYLPSPEGLSLPLMHSGESSATMPYRARPYGDDPGVTAFVRGILEETDGETLRFINRLNETLHQSFTRTIRESGAPCPPSITLDRRMGACRDLAVLFMDCCRSVGLPARFASGYQKGDGQRERRFLHAWPEVYVEGGGWRGYDPTHGLVVADEHVLVAAAADPADAAPVEGGFGSAGAGSKLEFDIHIGVLP
jgi:transglutaminase-like putative cysteine protease